MNHFRLSYRIVLCVFALLFVSQFYSQVSATQCYNCSSLALNGQPVENEPYNDACWNDLDAIDVINCPDGCATVMSNGFTQSVGYAANSEFIFRICRDDTISKDSCYFGDAFNNWVRIWLAGMGKIITGWFYEGSACSCTEDKCNDETVPDSERFTKQIPNHQCYNCKSYTLNGKPSPGAPYDKDCMANLDEVDVVTCPFGCSTMNFTGAAANGNNNSTYIERSCNFRRTSDEYCIMGLEFNIWYKALLDKLDVAVDSQWSYDGYLGTCADDKCNGVKGVVPTDDYCNGLKDGVPTHQPTVFVTVIGAVSVLYMQHN